MVERLTDEVDADFDYLMTCLAGTTRGTRLVRIRDYCDALLSQLREQRELLEGDKDGCCQHYGHCELLRPDGKCQVHERLAEWHRKSDAAERTVTEQREALERLAKFQHRPVPPQIARGGMIVNPGEHYDDCVPCIALAALAPDTEGGTDGV